MNSSHRKKVEGANCLSSPCHHFKRTPELQICHHQRAGINRMSKRETGQFFFQSSLSLNFIIIPPDKKIRACCSMENRGMKNFRTGPIRTKDFFIVETRHPARPPRTCAAVLQRSCSEKNSRRVVLSLFNDTAIKGRLQIKITGNQNLFR